MNPVKIDGTYRDSLLTLNASNVADWPDIDIVAGHLSATKNGSAFAGTIAVSKATETGVHTVTLDATGAVAGDYLQLSGEYYVDSIRYYFSSEIYVDAGSAIQDSIDSDWVPVLNGGVWKGRTTKRGTSTQVIPDKNLKQSDGSDITDIDTQPIAGFTEE